jgi:hypothetical protein
VLVQQCGHEDSIEVPSVDRFSHAHLGLTHRFSLGVLLLKLGEGSDCASVPLGRAKLQQYER